MTGHMGWGVQSGGQPALFDVQVSLMAKSKSSSEFPSPLTLSPSECLDLGLSEKDT